jgi:hypothetical protein
MFPIPADRDLLIRQIADYWSRHLDGRASPEELCQVMLQGFWRGELRPTAITRLDYLRTMYEAEPTDHFVLCPIDDDGYPMTMASQAVDEDHIPPLTISVPNDSPESWTEEVCESTFRWLAHLWDKNNFPAGFRADTAVLSGVLVTAEQFFAFVDRCKIDRPTFWTPPPIVSTPSDRRRPVNEATARTLYQDYSESCDTDGSRLTQQGFETFVRDKGYSGGRPILRNIFKTRQEAAGNEVKPGRPRNSPAEK